MSEKSQCECLSKPCDRKKTLLTHLGRSVFQSLSESSQFVIVFLYVFVNRYQENNPENVKIL